MIIIIRVVDYFRENIDWKQKALEISAVSGLGWFANMTYYDLAGWIEKAITFLVSAGLAVLALRRHKKKMRLMDLEEQERLQRLYDMGAERKRKEDESSRGSEKIS